MWARINTGRRAGARLRPGRRTAALALFAAVAAVAALAARPHKQAEEAFNGLPRLYTYLEADTSRQVRLHLMGLAPDDVVLRAAGTALRPIAAYGINGGFFYGKDLLSIAVMNDTPAGGVRGAYGSGWFNAKYARGTLIYDGAAGMLSVQKAAAADELNVTDRGHYWAQGGVSMNVQQEELWAAEAEAEHLPFADEARLRSGMVYDDAGKVWLIVSESLCTAADFRTAVLEAVPGGVREGIFLDGDGSSQMNAAEAVLTGDSRPVMQMIAVSTGK
ncbi:phosphodiester glycosidase family protein [Paenibacillus sp. NFR01]|uniref:phosphodiester glycosidase family protein n=1 Tax=Paenibacillus sp. NFR01 TaxID=1566279 RepID=UPI0008BDEAD3|nr:phosphodiester glycosidase family protein [Paenibacillus sp. NFR01]SES99790.1 Predicted protein [Paenibacillus sp. NFR01]